MTVRPTAKIRSRDRRRAACFQAIESLESAVDGGDLGLDLFGDSQ